MFFAEGLSEETINFGLELIEEINNKIDNESQTIIGGAKCAAFYEVIQMINKKIGEE